MASANLGYQPVTSPRQFPSFAICDVFMFELFRFCFDFCLFPQPTLLLLSLGVILTLMARFFSISFYSRHSRSLRDIFSGHFVALFWFPHFVSFNFPPFVFPIFFYFTLLVVQFPLIQDHFVTYLVGMSSHCFDFPVFRRQATRGYSLEAWVIPT